ncbi:MAG: MarR family transcriptional regulator [Acidobacteriota bacterium]|jgi:DNA-binding MarR family transcriptional regulator|nr:MarR family transcriptional regulator [Acidobacteriota bacterium]
MSGDANKADRLCRLFCNVIDEIITARALAAVEGEDISRAQFQGLQFIYLHPMCCIKDLAEGLDVSHPAAVKLVERIEAKGYITRSAYEPDRRIVQLQVSPEGEALSRQVIEARNQAIDNVLSRLGAPASCDLLRCLEKFVMAALEDQKDMDGVCLHCGGTHVDTCPVCQAEYAVTGEMRRDS